MLTELFLSVNMEFMKRRRDLVIYVEDVNFQLQLKSFTAGSNIWWSIKNETFPESFLNNKQVLK